LPLKGRVVQTLAKASVSETWRYVTCGLAVSLIGNNELSVESDRIGNIYTSESLWNLQQCFLFSILYIFVLQSLN